MRNFWRFHFIKVLLVLVAIQLLFFYWLQKRNHRPVAANDEISVFEGQSVKIMPLRNDSDKDEEELTLHEVSSPSHGEITQDEDLLVYLASNGFDGVDSFAYTVSDGKKVSHEAFIKVTVNENLKPVANNDVLQSYPGDKLPIPIMDNDTDREGDSIFITEISDPLHGQLDRQGNLLFYTSNRYSAKTDSFHYVISDGFSQSENASVIINIKSINNTIYPWLSADVGNPSLPGSVAIKNGEMIIKGSGDDIWNNEDNFHFAYQIVNGDCEMITKIKSIENTNQWAKGGIMIRESLTGPSRNIYMCLTKQNGVNYQIRPNPGAITTSVNQNDGIVAPYWVKLVRKGNHCTGYRSSNGVNWIEVKTDSINLPKIMYIGLATASHNDEALCAVQYDLNKTMLKKK